MSEHTPAALFEQLRGEQLSAVTFVQDYLQLWFDGPGFNVLNPVTVYVEDQSARSWDDQFRNKLCSQIAKTVASVTVHEGTALKITFADGSVIEISLRPGTTRDRRRYIFMAF